MVLVASAWISIGIRSHPGPQTRFSITTSTASRAEWSSTRQLSSPSYNAKRPAIIEANEAADVRLMSVATFVEISIVIEARHGAEGLRDLDHFISRAGIEFVAVDAEHGKLARAAFSRFGEGRHRAGLNYGDCFSYAPATMSGEPLLFKGDDFGYTDVSIVDWSYARRSKQLRRAR